MLTTAARTVLVELGLDPDTPEVADTPTRYAKAMRELTRGMDQKPSEILSTVFPEEQDEMVVLVGVPFYSLCEHHMLPFFGTVTVGYLPDPEQGVVGLSKLSRLVECFAHRLQLQERLTKQIAESLMQHLGANGAGCVVKARHLCMEMRGVRTTRAEFTTSSLLGSFRNDHSVRTEFLALAHA